MTDELQAPEKSTDVGVEKPEEHHVQHEHTKNSIFSSNPVYITDHSNKEAKKKFSILDYKNEIIAFIIYLIVAMGMFYSLTLHITTNAPGYWRRHLSKPLGYLVG